MKVLRYLPIVLALALTSCNDLIVADLNNPGLDQLSENPTRSAVLAATQGLFISARTGMATRAGYVSGLGIVGRESYNFDAADPRFSAPAARRATRRGESRVWGRPLERTIPWCSRCRQRAAGRGRTGRR